MAHTHEYDCIVCGAHLDSQDQLARHNKENHLKGATGMERPRQSGSQSGTPSSSSKFNGKAKYEDDDRRS